MRCGAAPLSCAFPRRDVPAASPSIERRALHTFVQRGQSPGEGVQAALRPPCRVSGHNGPVAPSPHCPAHSPSLRILTGTPLTPRPDTRATNRPVRVEFFDKPLRRATAHTAQGWVRSAGTRCTALRRARLAIYGLARGCGATPYGGDAARASWPGGRSAARGGCGVPAAGT
jgi:hypothetical protein